MVGPGPHGGVLLLLGALLAAAACGGRSTGDARDLGDAASGGSGGSAERPGSGGTGKLNEAEDCVVDGVRYRYGESWPAPDGCNTCGCGELGVGCTLLICNTCEELEEDFAVALDEARICDATLSEKQCNRRVPSAVRCGCDTYVNEDSKVLDIATEYEFFWGCGGEVTCGDCGPEPVAGECGPDNRCIDVYKGLPR